MCSQLTREMYHFLDLILSFGFIPFSFLLCEIGTYAFWVSLFAIIMHDCTHFLTDFGDEDFPGMRRFTLNLIPLRWHTFCGDDIPFILLSLYVGFGLTEVDGISWIGLVFYKFLGIFTVVGFVPIIVAVDFTAHKRQSVVDDAAMNSNVES